MTALGATQRPGGRFGRATVVVEGDRVTVFRSPFVRFSVPVFFSLLAVVAVGGLLTERRVPTAGVALFLSLAAGLSARQARRPLFRLDQLGLARVDGGRGASIAWADITRLVLREPGLFQPDPILVERRRGRPLTLPTSTSGVGVSARRMAEDGAEADVELIRRYCTDQGRPPPDVLDQRERARRSAPRAD